MPAGDKDCHNYPATHSEQDPGPVSPERVGRGFLFEKERIPMTKLVRSEGEGDGWELTLLL